MTSPESHRMACRKYRLTHKEQVKESQRKYKRIHPERVRERHRKYHLEHRDLDKKNKKKYRQKHKERVNAENMAERCCPLAPCCQFGNCPSTENLERAHLDYDKPLEVVTLCRKHHFLIDRLYRRFD